MSGAPLWAWAASDVAGDALAAGEVSAVEVVETCLRRIDELEPAISAFITLLPDAALAAARAADDRRGGGRGCRRCTGCRSR